MKTVGTKILKWRLFEVAKRYGSHFEKNTHSNCGFEFANLPDSAHGNKLNNGI